MSRRFGAGTQIPDQGTVSPLPVISGSAEKKVRSGYVDRNNGRGYDANILGKCPRRDVSGLCEVFARTLSAIADGAGRGRVALNDGSKGVEMTSCGLYSLGSGGQAA